MLSYRRGLGGTRASLPAGSWEAVVLKGLLLKPLAIPGCAETLAHLTGTAASVFMAHRFSSPEEGVVGHDPSELRRNLAYLRRRRYTLISLGELLRKLREGTSTKRAVAFTIDDGYFETGRVAAPIFAEFDCPVTTFVTTGFLDGKTWLWWDRLEFIFETTRRTELRARLGSDEFVYRLDSAEERAAASRDLSLRCQDASEADRLRCILELGREADVEVPATAPARFASLSWAEARSLEKQGMTFGPHTVTHPVLSSTADDQAESEIVESWRRLCQQVLHPTPVFCYPSGRHQDYGEREIAIVRELGLWGAVTAQPGEIHHSEFRQPAANLYRIPRFAYRDSLPHVLQSVSGLETVKLRLRRISGYGGVRRPSLI